MSMSLRMSFSQVQRQEQRQKHRQVQRQEQEQELRQVPRLELRLEHSLPRPFNGCMYARDLLQLLPHRALYNHDLQFVALVDGCDGGATKKTAKDQIKTLVFLLSNNYNPEGEVEHMKQEIRKGLELVSDDDRVGFVFVDSSRWTWSIEAESGKMISGLKRTENGGEVRPMFFFPTRWSHNLFGFRNLDISKL